MITKLLNQAQYELLNYPHYSAGQYLSQPLKILFNKNVKRLDKFAFGNGILAKAMMDFYSQNVNTEEGREAYETVKRYYDRWIMGGCKMHSISDVYSGMALMDIYKITGAEKYKKGIDAILDYVHSLETDDLGSIIYHQNKEKPYVYADVIGMICPFLAKYANRFDDISPLSLAVTQIQNYLQFGMDDKLMLPYHGYDAESGIKYGIVGWGMAVGFIMMGMSETLYYMDPNRPNYEHVKQGYRRIVDKVEAYQAEGGLYHWQLSAKEGPADTGATAMILYSISQSLEDKVLIGIHKSRMLRGLEALLMCVQEDGTLPGATKHTEEFNNYPLEFASYPWALGPMLSLLVMHKDDVATQLEMINEQQLV